MEITRKEVATALVTIVLAAAMFLGFITDATSIDQGTVSAVVLIITYLLGTINFLPNSQ